MASALEPVSIRVPGLCATRPAASRSPRFKPVTRKYESLRGRKAFSRAYGSGTRVASPAATTIVLRAEPGPPRVGIVAGRRIGGAVLRNRAKRRLREAASRCVLQPDTVYVFIAEPAVLSIDFGRLTAVLTDAVVAGVSGEEDE